MQLLGISCATGRAAPRSGRSTPVGALPYCRARPVRRAPPPPAAGKSGGGGGGGGGGGPDKDWAAHLDLHHWNSRLQQQKSLDWGDSHAQ